MMICRPYVIQDYASWWKADMHKALPNTAYI